MDMDEVAEHHIQVVVKYLRSHPAERLPWIVRVLTHKAEVTPVFRQLLDTPPEHRGMVLAALRGIYGAEAVVLHFNDGDMYTSRPPADLIDSADLVWSQEEPNKGTEPQPQMYRAVIVCLDGPGDRRREWVIEFGADGTVKDAVENQEIGEGNLHAQTVAILLGILRSVDEN